MTDTKEWTPEDLAQELFTKDPEPPCTQQLGAMVTGDGSDATYLFELIVTFMMEGMDILLGGLKNADLSKFTLEHITSLEQWFRAIGFTINAKEYDQTESYFYEGYYCSVIINSGETEKYFDDFHINKNYHFLLNGQYLRENEEKTDLKDVYMVFRNQDKVYVISFDYFYPTVTNSCR